MLASTHSVAHSDSAPNPLAIFPLENFQSIERFDSIQNAKIFRCENLRVLLDHMLGALCTPLLCTELQGEDHIVSPDGNCRLNRVIRPILAKHCLSCHGRDDASRQAICDR